MIEFDTDGSAMLRFAGEIDVANAGRIPQQVTSALAAPVPGVVLDLADVTFIDSTGIGALIAARNACVAAARTLRLARPSSQVQRMLEMTGLDDIFEVIAF
ncbi:MAG: anti-sigma-factor antagonist [Pseudonocardiales bacterium]|nr:anti-sigma-factor antagonist [Pseudonocardiales bacterium]